jgi:uncharacterized membrane protein YphA (DoxX/SURF4 family)
MQISKSLHIIVWGLQLLVAYILFQAGFSKLQASPQDVQLFTTLGMESQGRLIIGFLECLAATGLLMPFSAALSAFLGIGILSGAFIAHLTYIGWEGITWWIVAYLSCLCIVLIRRQQLPFSPTRFQKKSYI